MTVQSIVLYPEAVLRTRAEEVTEFDDKLGALVDDLLETMAADWASAIGILDDAVPAIPAAALV